MEGTFDHIGLLVLEGDAAALAATVSELAPSAWRPRARAAAVEAAALDHDDGLELPGSRAAS